MTSQQYFENLVSSSLKNNKEVTIGKMMSSPGIQYKSKNFAFFHKGAIFFRLGKEYDIQAHGVKEINYLNPFKTQPPLKAWYQVSFVEKDAWEELLYIAFKNLKQEID